MTATQKGLLCNGDRHSKELTWQWWQLHKKAYLAMMTGRKQITWQCWQPHKKLTWQRRQPHKKPYLAMMTATQKSLLGNDDSHTKKLTLQWWQLHKKAYLAMLTTTKKLTWQCWQPQKSLLGNDDSHFGLSGLGCHTAVWGGGTGPPTSQAWNVNVPQCTLIFRL